jgi:hypothetical protein
MIPHLVVLPDVTKRFGIDPERNLRGLICNFDMDPTWTRPWTQTLDPTLDPALAAALEGVSAAHCAVARCKEGGRYADIGAPSNAKNIITRSVRAEACQKGPKGG